MAGCHVPEHLEDEILAGRCIAFIGAGFTSPIVPTWKMLLTHAADEIVADGPRGPFGEAKIGILKAAKETGLPLIPVMWWARRKIILKNWDRTVLPLPFTRIAFFYDPPIYVPSDATREQLEEARVALTDNLNQMRARAQEYFGES